MLQNIRVIFCDNICHKAIIQESTLFRSLTQGLSDLNTNELLIINKNLTHDNLCLLIN